MKRKSMLALVVLVALAVVGCQDTGTGDGAPVLLAVGMVDCPESYPFICMSIEVITYPVVLSPPVEGGILEPVGGGKLWPVFSIGENIFGCPTVPPGQYDLWVIDQWGRESNRLEITL